VNGRRLIASESIGLVAFAAPEDPTVMTPARALGPGSGAGAGVPGGSAPMDAAAGNGSAAASGSASDDELGETESVAPGLGATRVGSPDPEDGLQRGLRAFRRSAGRGKGAADAVYGRIQRVTQAEGAGESGLSHVLEMGAVINAGDLLVTLALANSLFFSVKPDEARSKVALYLLITMVPFTLLAPLIGPLLDRLRGGRRFAMAVTALTRALLCLVMAKTISGGGLRLSGRREGVRRESGGGYPACVAAGFHVGAGELTDLVDGAGVDDCRHTDRCWAWGNRAAVVAWVRGADLLPGHVAVHPTA
jgi:hypothetical protein